MRTCSTISPSTPTCARPRRSASWCGTFSPCRRGSIGTRTCRSAIHATARCACGGQPIICAPRSSRRWSRRRGEVWNYSGGCSELLGTILRKTTGQPLDAFARETLFAPLGIADTEWLAHADGTPSASGGLHMRSRDFAKIGQVVAARGRSNGRAIVPAQWIADSIAPQIGAADRLFFYGYHWWLGRSLVDRKEITWASAVGFGGQRLYVVPSLDLVVVVTAGHYADGMQAWLPLVILHRFVLPAASP